MNLNPALLFFLFLLSLANASFAQKDSSYSLTFNFNDHRIAETDNKVQVKPVGITLTEDRFGNEESAIYLQGNNKSYLNLSTSPLLKSPRITISLWAKLDRRIYAGKGYDTNPIILTKNGPGHDFTTAYGIGYDGYSGRFCAGTNKDSTEERNISSIEKAEFGRWYHLVLAIGDKQIAFYVDGKLQQQFQKDFEIKFLESDSVMIGNYASTKNDRYSQGSIDDIQIFHRMLNAREVQELYKAPDPNKWHIVVKWILVIAGSLLIFGLIIFIVSWRYQLAFKKEKERNDLEIMAMKAQMNPHFIFNSLNSIQHFILSNDNDNAYRYLTKFSKLLRKILESNNSDSLFLEEETDILKHYLEIESLRFNGIFSYEIAIDPSLPKSNIKIPHMLIQPFVENAIWHGLLHKEGEKNLRITFSRIDEKSLLCIVDDNGVGRGKNAIQSESILKKKSLAIEMIRQRLELIRKAKHIDCGFEIIDKKDIHGNNSGTTVKITIPVLN